MNDRLYIWQEPEWPRFDWDAHIVLPLLGDVRALQASLITSLSFLGFNVEANRQLSAMTDDIISSSAIEGVALNIDSVRSSIARRLGIEIDGPVATDHYVEGLIDIMHDVTSNFEEALSADRLFRWHCALFPMGLNGIYRIDVGCWRRGEEAMQVVSGPIGYETVHYEASPSARVPAEMERFLDWAENSEEDNIIKAAIAHLWFVSIHPFDDGNGRISRSIADYFISRADGSHKRFYSMSAEILRNKRDYYNILEKTQKGDLDITGWIMWFLNCLKVALENATATIRMTLRKAVYWRHFEAETVNERQRKVLNRLWDGFVGKLTSSKWAKICHCSQDTATRDINDLLEKGMLAVGPGNGRSKHYLLPGVWVE